MHYYTSGFYPFRVCLLGPGSTAFLQQLFVSTFSHILYDVSHGAQDFHWLHWRPATGARNWRQHYQHPGAHEHVRLWRPRWQRLTDGGLPIQVCPTGDRQHLLTKAWMGDPEQKYTCLIFSFSMATNYCSHPCKRMLPAALRQHLLTKTAALLDRGNLSWQRLLPCWIEATSLAVSYTHLTLPTRRTV